MSDREQFEAAFPEAWSSWNDAAQQYLGAVWPTAWLVWQTARSGQAASGSSQGARSDVQNGVGVGQPEAPTAAPPGSWDEYAMHEAERLWSLPAMPKAQLLACVHCALIDAMKFAAAWRVEVVRVKPLMPPARSGAGSEEGQG